MELAQIIPMIPQAGVAGILLAVIGVLLRQNHQDRTQYRADVARIEARAAEDAQEARENAARDAEQARKTHSSEMAEVREELRKLRGELETQRKETDEERRKRWHAEDAAAQYRRELEQVIGRTVEGS